MKSMSDRDGASVPHRVQSVHRAMELLKAVAEAGSVRNLTALARQCDLNRTTAWRLLLTLEAHGMVVRDARDGWFMIGPAVGGLLAEPSRSFVEIAQPVLERVSLETGEIACLGVMDGDEVRYVSEVIPAIVRQRSWLGKPLALHASSVGKAFLAHLEDDKVVCLVGEQPERFTDTTITDLLFLRAELRRVRAKGFAVCQGESEPGSWGVAAAVLGARGEPIAALCLWGPDRRRDEARLEALGRLAHRAARELKIA